MIDFETEIPEKDKCCINCMYFGSQMDTGDERLCRGWMPCLNYHEDNEDNYFIPDDDYPEDEFGCRACTHYLGEDEWSEECESCSRRYSDQWERANE